MNRILIAEDEPRLAAFLEKGLRSNGFVTTTVGDGAKAVMLADQEDFDLLVLDLGLPVKDGFTVLQELRSAGRRIPVIILSARDDVRDKVSGLEHGADDYVTRFASRSCSRAFACGCAATASPSRRCSSPAT